jgi:hypothetical protein
MTLLSMARDQMKAAMRMPANAANPIAVTVKNLIKCQMRMISSASTGNHVRISRIEIRMPSSRWIKMGFARKILFILFLIGKRHDMLYLLQLSEL